MSLLSFFAMTKSSNLEPRGDIGRIAGGIAVVVSLLIAGCSSSASDNTVAGRIIGKWTHIESEIADYPASFWFKKGGTVVCAWQDSMAAMRTSGSYKVTDDTHVEVNLTEGTSFLLRRHTFEIVRLTDRELILREGGETKTMHRVQ